LTNNVSEYLTLLKALELAAARGIPHLEILSDSELMVKQLRGEYRVKHEDLIPLAERYRRLRPKFKTVKLLAVRREFNKRADELANYAIRQAAK
jgi:ribonuclease HI